MMVDKPDCCYFCHENKKTYSTFGKKVCHDCLLIRKTGRKGHSGMIYHKETNPANFQIENKELCLIKVKKSHKLFVKWYIEHYPKSKGIVGRQINYLIYLNGTPVGIISASSPPRNYKKFRQYFGVTNDQSFVNNNVFRLIENIPNLGTRILKLFRNQIRKDYLDLYKDNLLGIVTFVEPPRNGALYKADNWFYLGETQGIEVKRRGEDWINKQYSKGTKKHIFVYKYK
jgi:hypothetical protein